MNLEGIIQIEVRQRKIYDKHIYHLYVESKKVKHIKTQGRKVVTRCWEGVGDRRNGEMLVNGSKLPVMK